MAFICPKCKQQDKGFSKQWLVNQDVRNDLVPTRLLPELIPDTTRYFCLTEDCGWDGSKEDLTWGGA